MVKSAQQPPKKTVSRVSGSAEWEYSSINHLSLTVCECQSSELTRGERSGSISVDGISRIMDVPAERGGAAPGKAEGPEPEWRLFNDETRDVFCDGGGGIYRAGDRRQKNEEKKQNNNNKAAAATKWETGKARAGGKVVSKREEEVCQH